MATEGKLELEVGGFPYEGWKSIRQTNTIEGIAGSFDLEVSDRWAGEEAWPIVEGDSCRVRIDGKVVIDGYVDKRRLSVSKEARSLSYSGRDRAGDLVDCSAIVDAGSVSKGKWTFTNVDVLEVATAIARPYGIKVSLQAGLVGLTKNKKIVLHPGDTCFEVIVKLAAATGVIVVSDGAGGIVITRSGTTRATPLVEGENIEAASVEYDASDRYHRYLISSQVPGTDEASGEATNIKAQATDEDIRSARTLIIKPDKGYSAAEAKARADWEARIRAARSEKVNVTVQGWYQPSGKLWQPNTVTHVQASRSVGVDGDMLISQVDRTVSEAGTFTNLSLVRPDAFTPEPTQTVKSGGGRWKELDGPVPEKPQGALGALKAFKKRAGF